MYRNIVFFLPCGIIWCIIDVHYTNYAELFWTLFSFFLPVHVQKDKSNKIPLKCVNATVTHLCFTFPSVWGTALQTLWWLYVVSSSRLESHANTPATQTCNSRRQRQSVKEHFTLQFIIRRHLQTHVTQDVLSYTTEYILLNIVQMRVAKSVINTVSHSLNVYHVF